MTSPLHCASVCIATKFRSNSQFGLVKTPLKLERNSVDRPWYGPETKNELLYKSVDVRLKEVTGCSGGNLKSEVRVGEQ